MDPTAIRQRLNEVIRDIPDFPQPGIIFKDITPLLLDIGLFGDVVGCMVARGRELGVEKVAGIDARGFLFGPSVALELGVGFVPVRKKGKLPWKTLSRKYDLEYGSAEIEIHQDAFRPGDKVLLVDDLLATGGTAGAAASLIAEAGGRVVEAQFLIELTFLPGRQTLHPVPVFSFLEVA
jgi:adenine phosphoribosyltransferase